MARSRRSQVRERARNQCEYCAMPQSGTTLPHELDHIRSKKHHGPTSLENLCWACAQCNGAKSSNAAGYDPETNALFALFNPRQDAWDEHFEWRGPILAGKTPAARATIDVLRINDWERVAHRRLLMAAGAFPPSDE